jgi:hypothetical protein
MWSGWAPRVVDEIRQRLKQATLGRRGHKHDPLYEIRGLIRHGLERRLLSQSRRPAPRSKPDLAVLPAAPLHLHVTPPKGRQIAQKRYSTATTPVGYPRLPGSAAPSAPEKRRSWPTLTPQGLQRRHRSRQPDQRKRFAVRPRVRKILIVIGCGSCLPPP